MKKILLRTNIILLFFISTISNAQTLYDYGKIKGDVNTNTICRNVEFDDYNYHIITGTFFDSVDIDPTGNVNTLFGGSSAAGVYNSFVSYYDASGSLMFGKKFGNTGDSVRITAAGIEYSGNFAVAGTFTGTVDFADNAGSPFYLTATGGADGFVTYFDYNGNFISAMLLDVNGGTVTTTDISFDTGGNVNIVGYFSGTIDMDPSGANTFFTATAMDGFVGQYSFGLNLINCQAFIGPGNQKPQHLIMVGTEFVIGGIYDTSFDFDLFGGIIPATPVGGTDIFLAYYKSNLLDSVTLAFGGAGNENMDDLYFMGSNGYAMLLDFEQTVDFDPFGPVFPLTSQGLTDVAFARYDMAMNLGFAISLGNAGANKGFKLTPNEQGAARSTNPFNDFIFTMNFSGNMDFDPDAGNQIFDNSTNTPVNSAIINIDSAGNYLFHGITEASSIKGITTDGFYANDILMVGDFSGTTVDLLPYDNMATMDFTPGNAIYQIYYNRCHLQIGTPYIKEPFECGTNTVKLGVEPLSGGIYPFNYFWSNGDYNSTDQYPADAYQDNQNYFNVSVSDHYGCNASDTLWILAHDSSAVFDFSINITNTSCGNDFGSAQVFPTNSLGTTSYYWSDGDTDDTADSLLAENYFVQVTDDSLLCFISKNFFINNSDGPQITINSSNNPACGGTNDGMIDVTVTGGASPYTFHWTNGATTEDISGLSGGTYTLNVIDAAGCENMICITLNQPTEIYGNFNTMQSSCFSTDGAISIDAYGGDGPYSYQWDAAAGNSTNDTVWFLPAGIYSVMVTDSIGCSQTFSYGFGDWNGPYAYVNWITNPDCIGTGGFIDMYSYDWNFTGFLNYQWLTGETTEDIAVTNGGTYQLMLTDGIGCKGYSNAWVYQSKPLAPVICMVTVDSTATQNVVVWDKSTTQEADYYNIYREGFCNSNDFGIVGSVDFDSLSVFYDTVVNSDTRTWQYYVTAVDTCGYESDPSEVHRTIHLSATFDADTNLFLDWSDYVGMQILGYKIYRENPAGTAFVYVDSVDAFQTNYTDTIDFTPYLEVEYFVYAIPASVCNATRAYNQNEARSNHSRAGVPQDTSGSTINLPELISETSFNLYPNPSNETVNLQINGGKLLWQMEMTDQTGRLILNGTVRDRASFSVKDIPAGVYFIKITSDTNEIHTMKLMVIH